MEQGTLSPGQLHVATPPDLALGGMNHSRVFTSSGWALTAHICSWVMEGLSWLLSTQGVGIPSRHFGGAEHTASSRQLRWAAGRGLRCSQMRGAM